MGRLFWLNYKARDPRRQRHRIQISDNCVKTALCDVMVQPVVVTQKRTGSVLAQLADICDLRL